MFVQLINIHGEEDYGEHNSQQQNYTLVKISHI